MALLAPAMEWPQTQESSLRSHLVTSQSCLPQPYNHPLTGLAVTSATPFSLTESSSADFVDYVLPRYIQDQRFMLGAFNQDYNTFGTFSWAMQPSAKLDQNDDYGNLMFTGNDDNVSPVEVEAEPTALLEGGPVTYSNAITQTTPSADNKADTGNTIESDIVVKTEAADCMASPLGRSLSDR